MTDPPMTHHPSRAPPRTCGNTVDVQRKGAAMAIADNKATIRRMMDEVMSRHDLQTLDDLLAQDVIAHDPSLPEDVHGRDAFRQMLMGYIQAFPDLQFTVDDLIGEGDEVVTRWTARGTQRGSFMGVHP